MALVNQPGFECVIGEIGSADEDVTFGSRLQSPDHFGVDLPLNLRFGSGYYLQRARVDDFVGCLPYFRKVTEARRRC